MKSTRLVKVHHKLGAKMVPFAGYEMPLEYSGLIDEHKTVRKSAGLFDVSHMGNFWVKGENAFQLLQKVTVNDISTLEIGQAQYSCFPNGKGGIVDDLIIYRYEHDKYFLVVNAVNIDKDWSFLVNHNSVKAELENASDKISQVALQGPDAQKILSKLTDTDLTEIKNFYFKVGTVAGSDNVIISATGYTGAGGYELYFYNREAENIWNSIIQAGKEYGIKPIGLGARDTLRLEMGYCLYGNDINDTTSPIEAGLDWIVKFTDGNDFIDRELFWNQKNNGAERKLVGFVMQDRGIPRHDYDISNSSVIIGKVTSGSISPMLNTGIGMGYVSAELAKPGKEIFIIIRNKSLRARIVKFPIYKENP